MSLKSRILRITAIVVGVIAFAGYFAFTTFFFSPFEGDLSFDVSALAPRDVDFFVAKAELSTMFKPFPDLAAQAELDRNEAWKTWTASPEWKSLARDMHFDESMTQLRAQLAQIPFGLKPLNVFGGKDLAVAGYFRGTDLQQADWAVYGRANWMGKFVASALRYPSLLGLEKQGITAKPEEDYVAISGGQLPRPLFITRIRDVVVVATQADFVKKAHELERKQYEDSLHQSANYHDWIQTRERDKTRDEIEIYLNTRKLLESVGFQGEYPNTKSQDFTPAFLGRLFQFGSMKNVMGIVGHDGGLQVDLHGEFSSELITKDQEKFYRAHGFDRAQLINEAARLAPADTALFVYVHGHMGDLLRLILQSIEPALRQNIEDQFRSTGKYQNLEQLVTQLDGALKDRAVLIVRKNDYPIDPDGPRSDGTTVPAIALVFWTQDAKAIVDIRNTIGENGSKFGLKGRNENEIGYFKAFEAGYETREYWSRLIPGTGVIATVNAGEITIITNCFRMIGNILKVQTQGGDKYPRLADEPRFEALVQSALPRSNLLVWANPETLAPILREMAKNSASSAVNVDWASITPMESKKILRDRFGGKDEGDLTPDEKTAFDEALDARLKALENKFKAEQVPTFMAKQDRMLTYFEATEGVLAMLALDPKSWDLTVRAPIPLKKPQ